MYVVELWLDGIEDVVVDDVIVWDVNVGDAALKALVGNAVVRRRRVSGAPLSEILARTPSLEKLWRTPFKIYVLKSKWVMSIVCWFKTHEGRYRFIVSR